MSIHTLILVDSVRTATDCSFHSVYDVRWHLLSTFLSPYTETAWSFLVWQTWDICLGDLAQEWLTFSTCKSFHFFTLVVAINLVTCFSFHGNETHGSFHVKSTQKKTWTSRILTKFASYIVSLETFTHSQFQHYMLYDFRVRASQKVNF